MTANCVHGRRNLERYDSPAVSNFFAKRKQRAIPDLERGQSQDFTPRAFAPIARDGDGPLPVVRCLLELSIPLPPFFS